jgi:hypothetical protein
MNNPCGSALYCSNSCEVSEARLRYREYDVFDRSTSGAVGAGASDENEQPAMNARRLPTQRNLIYVVFAALFDTNTVIVTQSPVAKARSPTHHYYWATT